MGNKQTMVSFRDQVMLMYPGLFSFSMSQGDTNVLYQLTLGSTRLLTDLRVSDMQDISVKIHSYGASLTKDIKEENDGDGKHMFSMQLNRLFKKGFLTMYRNYELSQEESMFFYNYNIEVGYLDDNGNRQTYDRDGIELRYNRLNVLKEIISNEELEKGI